jgi:hypothetical protein
METPQKVYENRVRRIADRQNLRIVKVGRRDSLAHDYGLYYLVRRFDVLRPSQAMERRGSIDSRREIAITPKPLPLAEIEKILLTPRASAHAPAQANGFESEHA